MAAAETLPEFLVTYAEEYPDDIALRRKHHGYWEELTWSDYLDRVKTVFYGLRDIVGDFDRLVMMTTPRTEYLFTAFAAQSTHATPFFTFPENWNLDELAHIYDTIDPAVYVVEDQEQLDKLLQIRDQIPEPEEIIVLEHYQVRKYEEDLRSYREVVERGKEARERHPDRFDRMVADIDPEDIAMFNRTSGTTGAPKIVMLQHKNFIQRAEQLQSRYPIGAGADIFSFLPTGWVGEQLLSVGFALVNRAVVNFPEDDDQDIIRRDFREISPVMVFAGPDFWESALANIQTNLLDSTRVKRWISETFLEIGQRWTETPHEDLPIQEKALKFVGDMLVYRQLRDHLGLANTEYAMTGGATLGPDLIREFRAFGVNFLQVYGQSELAGLTCTHTDWSNDIRSVGKPVEGMEFRITDQGEILTGLESGEQPFPGYYKNPEANEGVFTDDGFFKTEDHGHFNDDGELVIVDRMDHLITLEDGSVFSPRHIEDSLRYSPFISEAFAIGDGREYITCIVEIDWEHMSWWAEENGVPYTTYADLTERDEVRELVRDEIERVNADQPEKGRVRKFMIFDEMLDHEDEELTQTMKLKRQNLRESYADWIEAMYAADGEVGTAIDAEHEIEELAA